MIAASRKNLLRRISTTVLDRGRKISVDMSALSTSSYKPGIILCLVIFLVPQSTHSAPVYDQDTTQVAEYDGGATGCYYNFQHYQESDRIITNEPCLNCTCHNRMLMCYLRVCPFSKAIGQDCTVEKRPDQCCPVITCPEVPVQLLTSTTNAPATSDSTEIGFRDNYGCKIDDRFYPDGAQLPLDPQNPCELCYCIKNRTTCVIQECTLRVAGCKPAYQPGVCCPVKYNCEYDEELETTVGPISGLIMTTTIAPGATPQCYYEGKFYEDGELIYSTQPCQHCYCFRGDIACAVQDCGTPMKTHGENCTALPPPEGECCPTTYHCEDNGQSESITIPEGIEQTSEINQVQPIVTIPEKVEEPEEQEFEITSEAFPGADNAIPHDHEVKTEQTEESIKAVESTEKSTETTEEKEVTESETMYGSGEVNLPEEHDIELTPVNIPNTEIKSTEETQTIQNQNTEAPILIKETEKPISIEQTETPVPTEKITPIYTEKSEIPLVAENTEKPITIEETKTHVSEEETEIPITLEKSEDSSTKPSEGVQEAIEISITENVPTVSPSLEGLETETETAKKDQKIEQPESTEENVTLEEHQTQAITIEGAMKTEELTEPLISEQDHTESTYELVPSEETTNPQEPDGESGKSTEVIVSTEGVSEKTTETISQYESTTKLVENEEQSSLETKESEIPQEITEKVTTLNPEKSPIAEVTESEKPVEISESGKVEPTEITTSLLGVQETEQQYPPAEQKPKSPEPELELKEKLPPLAPKRDDFGSPEVDINQHPFVKEPHETEVDEQIFENIPGYKTEDKESIPEIHIIESNVDIKKPEMHAPESLVTETPEKALTSETASSTITKHEENEIETETKVEKPIEETIPDQKETSTTEITPTALDTKASHTPELHVSTEAQTVQEELEHTEKSIIPEDYVTGTIGPEIHLTEKITTVEELPTKGLTLGEFGETSSEEVSSETSNGNEEIMPGKEQFNEKEGEAEEKLQKPSSEEISTESSISEQESTSIPASEKSVEEGVDTISEISPTEKQPEIPQSEIQPTETSTEEEVTIKETEQKESIETPKISPPSETEQKEFMETSEVSKPSVTHTVNEVDVSETKAPEEPEIVKVTESTAVSEEATIVSEIVSEESTTKQTEEISTKEHILETSEITENIIPEEVSEQSVIPNNKSTESIEIAEAYTSVPSVIEEEPVVEEKSTEMPSLIEKEHTPTLISKEKSIEESEEEKKSEIIPTKEELTEKTPTTETQTTEKSTVKEESEEEKETESSVTGKYTTETSTVEVKGTEIISEQSTEKISEDEEQKIQKPSFEEEKSTESTVGEGKEPIDSLEKKLTEIITEEKTTKISIPEQPETSTMISEGENDVFEDNIREQSTEQAAVSETFSGQPTVSESTTELFSGTIPPVIESKVPIESHIEEKKQPETETSVTKEPSTEIPIQQEESTSIESISEKLIPEKQEGVVSTTKITDEINGSTSQPEESSKESTEAAIPVESSMITKEQEIEEHTEGISEEKSDEEKDHELTSSVGISTEETSSEVPIIKETTEIPEAEEKLHKTTLEIDEEKTTTKSIETHEEQSTIAPFKEEISGVKLTSPSLIITGIPSERPIEYSTEQQLADITEIIPTNEITESAESKPTSSDIPGEGNCLVDGQSYNNNSAIPPANPCQLSCQCISSIIQCELMLCPPPPTHLSNCMPVHTSGSSCCPIYTCDSTPTIELEADNHMIEHHTPKYEESEKPEHITSIPKVTEIPSAFSDHTGEGEGQEHVSSYPHTLETVSEHGSEIGKEEEAVEERITINPIESVSEESTITQEHKNLQEVSSKETFNIPLSEQSTTESTLSITTQKTVEVTEQEKEIVKFLPSTEESIVEQITEKVTSFPVAVETETTVLMEESEKIPEEGTEEGVSNEATEQTMSEASISTTAETMSEASISTTAETISEASISTVSEISNEVTEEQSKESETFGGIQEVIVSTEHGITSTEEEITQSAETEGQTKIEIETTKEKEQPDNLIEVTSERPTEHYTEQEFTDITKLVTTSEVSSQAPEEAKPTPVEHQTVEPESETTNINVSESNTEISTKIDLLITEDQTDISKATTTIKSESVSSYEEITTPTIESNQSTKIQESEILDEEKDKTIEQTTKSVEKSTEISTQQPTDQTDIPMVTEKQSIVHIEETPIPVTSKDTESSISTKTESTEPTVIVETETPLSSVEKHTEPTISVETQTSTLVSVEEHESEEIPKKSESAEKQKEEKPLEVTTTEKEISEPIEVEVTEHSIPSADSTTPTIEKHVTTTIEEQTMKFEETSTKEPIQEYTTLSISPIYEETIATSTLSNEKTSESIPMEEEQTKEKTLENIEGETVGPNTIIEEQTISSNVPIIHAEEEHQPEEITQKPFKEEATTSISITEIQPTLAVNEKTQQHLGEEISFNIEGTSTEKSESVAAEVTEQTKQIEEQKPKKEEQVGEGQPIETSEVSEVTETLVTFKEKPVESSIPEEKPTESSTLEEKPTESLTLEEKPTESPTLEEKPTESPTLEEKPTESPTLEGKPTESSILEEKPTESPTLEEKPTESPILEEKPVESSTLEEEPIESSTPEEKQSDVYITSESSTASESSTPSESFTPSESSTSSEPTTSKEKLIESSTSEGQLLESTSQENPIESLTPEEKPIEPLIPIEDHTETEQKTETPISKGETLKPSTYEGEIEKTSEQAPLEETQTTVEESVSKIPVIISSTETVQTELIEEQKGGETEEHSVTPIEEEKSETPESTESILIKEQEPTEGTTITDHLVSEEKATTVSTIREEEVQSTEAPAPTKEAPSKGEVEFPLAETEASSEVTIKEQSTTEPISEESITKSDEAEKGKEEITESTLPKEKPIPTSLSSITEEPEEKMTSGPVVTEEQELEILSVKPEKEQETTESSTEGFITKLRPIPTELSITETSEKISESDHEEGQEEVQSHIGITQPESSSQIPQTDKSEGQLTVGLDEEHLQPVNHTIETSEPILEEHHVTSSVTPQTGVEYPEQTVSGEDNPHFPMHGGSYLNPDEDYDEDDQAIYGPGTCRYGGKVYMSAQQIPRDDPCDFCFCFRSDIICLQQSCPPPIPGCHEEPISGFCCPRYECPVSMATSLNITTTTTTTTTTLPPHFLTHAYKGAAKRSGCQIRGQAYHVGEVITSASGPCLHCTCGGDGNMKCDPRVCSPEPMLRQMIAAATARRRR